MECKEIERMHPKFEYARKVENEEVAKGNYNYEGIGLPDDYNEFAKSFKK